MPLLLALLLASNATGKTLVRSQQGTMVTSPSASVLANFPFGAPGCYPTGSAMGTKGQTITVSRTGTRTCNVGTSSAPSLITCQANEACVEAAGPISEAARTNLVTSSGHLDGAGWASNSSGVPGPTITSDGTVGPDGVTTVTKLAFPAISGASQRSVHYHAFPPGDGPDSVSIALRTVSGTGTLYVEHSAISAATACPVTAAWSVCSVPNVPSGQSGYIAIGPDGTNTNQPANQPALTVYAANAQAEIGVYATSYVPAEGTPAARSADAISVPWPSTALASWCARVTAQPESSRAWNAATGYIWSAGTSAAANSARLSATTGGTLVLDVYDGAGTVRTATYTHGFAAGSSHVVTACSVGGTLGLYVDGAVVSPTLSGAGTGQWSAAPSTLYLGTLSSTGSEWEGYIGSPRVCRATSGCL